MAERRIGIIMHGVTGRMGMNQHLIRSILGIRRDGGVPLRNGDRLMPDPILLGRNRDKLEALARAHGISRVSTDLEACLADPADEIFFDAASTRLRAGLLRRAIAAGKHVYCEKPTAETLADALALAAAAKAAGVKNGVVQDKLFLPGLRKLAMVIRSGFLGRILSVRGEFGYWVFEGDLQPPAAPLLELPQGRRRGDHPRYASPLALRARHPVRRGEGRLPASALPTSPAASTRTGNLHAADADDAAYATFELEGGIIAQINSSWCVRVRRDDLVVFQVDGTHGSAVAGLTECWTQSRVNTPKPVWNPDVPQTIDFYAGWQKVPDTEPYPNGFRAQWEIFLRHVAGEVDHYPWDLLAGAKGVQLAEAALQSWRERRWIDLPRLEV